MTSSNLSVVLINLCLYVTGWDRGAKLNNILEGKLLYLQSGKILYLKDTICKQIKFLRTHLCFMNDGVV